MSIEAIANQRRATWLAVALLLLLPFGWLGSCVFGSEVFVPFDLAASPPMAQQLDAAQLLAARANSNYDVTEVPIWFCPRSGWRAASHLAKAGSRLGTQRRAVVRRCTVTARMGCSIRPTG